MSLNLFPFYAAMGQEYDQCESERLERIAKAWAAYYAKGPAPLKVTPGRPDDNTRINFLRRAVDKSVSFLFGEPITFQLDPDNETPEEDFLERVWTANRKQTTLTKLATNGSVCGHAFLKIVLNAPQMPVGVPRIVVLDPATVRAIHDPDDIETVRQYVIEYKGMDPKLGPMLYRQEITEADGGGFWTIVDKQRQPDASTWAIVDEQPWPYPFAPVVDCQNLPAPNEYWGMSDLEDDVVKVQNALDFVISNIRKIIRLHAHPKTWAKGFNVKDVKLGPEDVLLLDPEGEIHNLEMTSDLASSLETYRELKDALHVLTRIPPIATGKVDGSGPLSGIALRIHYGPLLELTNSKRMTYGEMLVELCRRLLAIAGHGDDKRVDILWKDALPADDLAEAQMLVIHESLGVSKETILRKLGYDPESEAKLKTTEAQAAMDAMSRAMGASVDDNGNPIPAFGGAPQGPPGARGGPQGQDPAQK